MSEKITLCGFAVSNYYNKAKLALLEKNIPFDEELVFTSQKDDMLAQSTMGKVPFLKTPHGNLTESQVIAEYMEDRWPEPPLYPRDAFARAQCRELIEHLELYLELPARRLYYEAFFGGKVSDDTKQEVERELVKGLKSLARIARFAPFIGGDSFTHADCAAWVHLPLVSQATRKIYGRDLVEELLPAAADYLKMIGERPHAKKVNEDRKAGFAAFAAKSAK